MKQTALRITRRLCAWLLATTFLFSGFVKAVDPQGMCTKLGAYFAAAGWRMSDDALLLQLLTTLLTAAEFLLGLHLLLGLRRKITARLTFLFLLLMTGLTFYIYLYEPVPDCGCFGEAVTLNNGATLGKNLVLLAAAVAVCSRPQDLLRLISERNQWLTSIWALIYVVGLTIWSFHYLPALEFTDYRKGRSLREALQNPASEESRTGLANFYAVTAEGEMVQDSLVAERGYTFLLIVPDETTADDGCNDRINDLYDYATDHDLRFCALLAEEQQTLASDWTDRTGAVYPLYLGESTQLKAMVRSNPGLLLLKDGRIVAKWSNNNLPELKGDERLETLEQEPSEQKALLKLLLGFFAPLLLFVGSDRLWIGNKYYKHSIFKKQLKRNVMRKKIVAGNWKMNKNLQEGIALAKELNEKLTADKPHCGVVICTPFIHLASVAPLLDESIIGLGAENCADKEKGAFTGEVSAEMVKSTGAQYVILGHSERRAYYGETAEILKEKVNLALANGLKVIFCIGEVLEEREANKQNEVVGAQLADSLFDLTAEQFAHIILAYEPVWAIGTGKTATAEQAEEMHAFIRKTIADKFGAQVAEDTTILYGGSCKSSNAKELFAKPDVDGGLIGGAALKADDFKGIIDAWK